ncbi:FixH family protein [Kaarinaea lacus]
MTLTHKLNSLISHLGSKYSQSNTEGKRNPWVIGWFGVVAVFLAVNAVFIVLAVVSNPGLVVEDYYEQGRQYEKNAIKRLTAHNKLQWQSKLEIPEAVTLNTVDTYRFSAVDSRGLPIRDADVQVVAYRPSDAGADFTTTLEPIAPGLYQASLSFPLPGIWDLNIKVQRGDDRLEMVQRLSVQSLVQ